MHVYIHVFVHYCVSVCTPGVPFSDSGGLSQTGYKIVQLVFMCHCSEFIYCVGYIHVPTPLDEASCPQVITGTPSLTSPSLHAWLILDVKGKCIFRNCTMIEVFRTRVGHPKMNIGCPALWQLHLHVDVESIVFHWNQS